MATTRREFIHNGIAFVSLGLTVPTFLLRAAAAPAGPLSAPQGKILVVIEMSGGNDGLNTVIPHADPQYAKLRPGIGIAAADVVPLGSGLGLHPKMAPLKGLYEKGQLAVVTGVGYPNPNRSHFQSMDIWQTGDPLFNIDSHSGWLARYLDADGHFAGKPLSSLGLSGGLPLALTAGQNGFASVYSNDDMLFNGEDDDQKRKRAAVAGLYAQGSVAGSPAEFVRNVFQDAYANSGTLKTILAKSGPGSAEYPPNDDLASGLQTIAKLITGGLETRVYYLNLGGFDTHANQPDQHGNLLGSLAGGLSAFFEDLTRHHRADDVIAMTFSEFGRRGHENASSGTDHGAASVMLLAGGLKGGIYGDYPSLTDLDDGDLRFHTDFRQIYATLLDKWLLTPSQPVLGGSFAHLGFV